MSLYTTSSDVIKIISNYLSFDDKLNLKCACRRFNKLIFTKSYPTTEEWGQDFKSIYEYFIGCPYNFIRCRKFGDFPEIRNPRILTNLGYFTRENISFDEGSYDAFKEIIEYAENNIEVDDIINKSRNINILLADDEVTISFIPTFTLNDPGIYNILTDTVDNTDKIFPLSHELLSLHLIKVYSKEFTIKLYDNSRKLHIVKKWSNNSKISYSPVINYEPNSKTTHSTMTITYLLDETYTIPEHKYSTLSYIQSYLCNLSLTHNLNVTFNSHHNNIHTHKIYPAVSMLDYVKNYTNLNSMKYIHYRSPDKWKGKYSRLDFCIVCVPPPSDGAGNKNREVSEDVSFANGIYTINNGRYVSNLRSRIDKHLQKIGKVSMYNLYVSIWLSKPYFNTFKDALITNVCYTISSRGYLMYTNKNKDIGFNIPPEIFDID